MKKQSKALIFWLIIGTGFIILYYYCRKHQYEEIHSPYIQEDGNVFKIERR
jgi:predicted negative regulator of RcsB-dependent stress response